MPHNFQHDANVAAAIATSTAVAPVPQPQLFERDADVAIAIARDAVQRTLVEFNTSEFEFSHGKSPRGLGSWAFSTKRHPDVSGPDMLWSPSMTFVEAKRWAREQVQGKGLGFHVTLFVQP